LHYHVHLPYPKIRKNGNTSSSFFSFLRGTSTYQPPPPSGTPPKEENGHPSGRKWVPFGRGSKLLIREERQLKDHRSVNLLAWVNNLKSPALLSVEWDDEGVLNVEKSI